MSEPAVAVAFFDPARELYGMARSGASVLFEGQAATVLAEGPTVSAGRRGRLRAELDGHFSLDLEPLSDKAELGGVSARVCRTKGEVRGTRVDCLGTVSETPKPPAWEELDAVRTVSALFEGEDAVLAMARRPREAPGHGHELTTGWLVQEGELASVERVRISTVYDGDGRQRSGGLELWLPGEDLPRRVSGTAIAGSSLELEGVRVHLAIFRWRMEEREGVGAYELMVRVEAPTAA